MKNKLVIYRGGCYDGCFWEWNAFLWNKDGQFDDIYSSGHFGVKDETAALSKTREIKGENKDGEAVYLVYSRKDMNEFQRDFAPSLVRGVLKALQDFYQNDPKYKGFIACDKCGNEMELHEIHFVNYQDEGGIVIAPHTKICEQCFEAGSCPECRDAGDSDDDHLYDPSSLIDGRCEWHSVEYLLESDRIANEDEGAELRELHQPIVTGRIQYEILWERFRDIALCQREKMKEQENILWHRIVKLWTSLSPAIRTSLILPEQN